jgi:phage tail-like protein
MRGTIELGDLVRSVGAEDEVPSFDGRATPPSPPHRIGALLPGLYQDDGFTQRFVAGLDPVLATVFVVLDSLEAYVDPRTAPADFVDWLAGWVGVDPRTIADLRQRRLLVHETAGLLAWHGTTEGLARLVELHTGIIPEIIETGAAASSSDTAAVPPGTPRFELLVRLAVDDSAMFDVGPIDRLVSRAKPAHVVHHIQVVER